MPNNNTPHEIITHTPCTHALRMQMHLHAHSYTLQVRRAVTAGLFMNAAQYSSTEYDAASASDPGTNVYRLLRHIAAGVTLVLPLLRFVLPHGISADVLSLRVIFPDTACHPTRNDLLALSLASGTPHLTTPRPPAHTVHTSAQLLYALHRAQRGSRCSCVWRRAACSPGRGRRRSFSSAQLRMSRAGMKCRCANACWISCHS